MSRKEQQKSRGEPGPTQENPAPGAESDDEIIGLALRRSAIVIAVLALGAALVFWARIGEEDRAPVDERPLEAPAAMSSAVESPEIPFADVTQAAGIAFSHDNGADGERLLPETMGGGVVFADLDGDALPDLLFVNSSPWPWSTRATEPAVSRLYLNNGDGSFRDGTAGSGLETPLYGMGAAIGDVNGDGLVDVFLTAVGANRMYLNRGGGRFEDATETAGVAGDPDRWSTSAAFLDMDLDGDLDLFVANYVGWSRALDFEVDYRLTGIGRAYGPPTNFPGTQSYLYRNDGNGLFEDVSLESGIWVGHPDTGEPVGKALAAVIEDVDADGWPDILVANDTVRNFYFRNVGGRFEEQAVAAGIAYDNSGHATGAMGIDSARHGEVSELAVAIANFANEMTSYYVDPDASGLFTDEAIIAGVGPASRKALSFGLFFFDADLDGRLDLLQANGHVENEINRVQSSQHHAQPAQLFWNCGVTCPRRFVPLPPEQLGDLPQPLVGRGAAYADMDLDGDLDVVITQAGGPARLFRNDQAAGNHWLRVRLEGPAPNRHGIGTRIRVLHGGAWQERRVGTSRSYLAQTEFPLTFGLGGSTEVQRLEVIWPDGHRQEVSTIPADQEFVLRRR